MSEISLGLLSDVPENGSSGFVIAGSNPPIGFAIIRRGDEVFVYANSCPHVGTPLDFTPGQFLNIDGTHIICATHGAQFRIEDGYCISGPCTGKTLTGHVVRVHQGVIYIDPDT